MKTHYAEPLCAPIDLMAETQMMASSTNNYIEDMDVITGSWGEINR